MSKFVSTAALLIATIGVISAAEAAAPAASTFTIKAIGAGLAAGIGVLGAGLGIGKLAAAALEGTARQPSAAGDIKGTMILAAALIEGVALFGVAVGFLCLILG